MEGGLDQLKSARVGASGASSLSVAQLQRLADKLAKSVMAYGDVEPNTASRDPLSLVEMAHLTRSLSATALSIGEPKASVLLRLASLELSGSEKVGRSVNLSDFLDTLPADGV